MWHPIKTKWYNTWAKRGREDRKLKGHLLKITEAIKLTHTSRGCHSTYATVETWLSLRTPDKQN